MQTYTFSLLKAEEYLKHESIIPTIGHEWWLQDGGYNSSVAFYIGRDGVFGRCDFVQMDKGIRPVVTISNPEGQFNCGQKFVLGKYEWVTLETGRNYVKALSADIVAVKPFDKSENKFETSKIKQWLNYVCCVTVFSKDHR